MITCDEDIKDNANLKTLVLSHPLVDLGVTHHTGFIYGLMESVLSTVY